MNYESQTLAEITEKLSELETLLNDAKNNISDEAILKKFSFSFETLKTALINEITTKSQKATENLENQIKTDVQNSTSELFNNAKSEILEIIKNSIDLQELSQKTAENFINENKINLQNALKNELNEQDFSDLMDAYKTALSNELEKILQDSQNLSKKLATNLKNIELNFKNIVANNANATLKEYINENKAEIFKPFSLNFLKNDILKDSDFKKAFKATARQTINDYLITSGLKNELSENITQINENITNEIFNNQTMKEKLFTHNLILASLSLTNELKITSLTMRELKESINIENSIYQNIYKVI